MSLHVFLSGVSSEFRDRRQSLATLLRRFRNLSIDPIIQEDLTEASTPSGALVDKLIANVRQCSLVICLVGHDAGYPHSTQERLECMRLAEERLSLSYQKSDALLGGLWHAWRELNLGMTYTQLEFFLAASVFSEDTRTRVCLPIPNTNPQRFPEIIQAQRLLSVAAESRQDRYLEFLRASEQLIDWCDLDSAETDVVTLAVEFALQQRDISLGVGQQVSAREAVQRGVIVLKDLNLRARLTDDAYRSFYRDLVWPRLTHNLITLADRSDYTSLIQGVQRLFAVASDHSYLIVAVSTTHIQTLRYSGNLAQPPSTEVVEFDGEHESFLGASCDGRIVLTHTPHRGYVLRTCVGFERAFADPDWRPDQLITVLNHVGGDVTAPWFTVRRGEQFFQFSASKPNATPCDAESLPPACTALPLSVIPLSMTNDEGVYSLPMTQSWSPLDPKSVVCVAKSRRRFAIHRYQTIRLSELFLICRTPVYEGTVTEVCIESVNRMVAVKASLAVRDDETPEIQEALHIGSEGDWTIPIPLVFMGSSNLDSFPRIHLPGDDAMDKVWPFDGKGRYGWSPDGQYLVFVEEISIQMSSTRRQNEACIWVYRFPRPLRRETADQLLRVLEELIDGLQPIMAMGRLAPTRSGSSS
ncbi:DUF4062 domain-containing protein [Stieleria varia]|uniref:DUF4062 domain-containing protein n=1 Tax=Stieleria varia TaxID=2528005 RepID=A0A5C6B7C8_9BACT|nr:DUF4062 domain-containing protein [Stieleria varia]TWU07953.1 hypothetical protein Pla52n_05300 [Stieleria varia]